MHSCLYTGRVAHARREPVAHRFRYRVAMAYLDLDEAAVLLRRSRWATDAPFGPWSFCTADHGKGWPTADTPIRLADAARDAVAGHSGRRPEGPVRLLTQLRQWGVYFSPVNLYYCFDSAGERLEAVVAEVSNTPWNERRRYVLDDAAQAAAGASVNGNRALRFRHAKDFHVSPFMGMDARYDWRLSSPGARLRVHIRSSGGGAAPFDATLTLVRRTWSDRRLAAMSCRFPAAGLQILLAIYWQAFRLWTKRCPYFPHPR